MIRLLTSFNGRVPLTRFWIGILIVWGLMAVCVLALSLTISDFGSMPDFRSLQSPFTALSLVFLYPLLAIMTKRLHDRNKPALVWLPIFWGPSVIFRTAALAGINLSSATISGTQIVPNPVGIVFSVISAIIGLWMIVELGFLKGTTGPNRFGPDPYQQ